MTQIAEQRMDKAGEYLREAEILRSERIGNLPVLANLYHAMMNCLFALFDVKEPGSLLHADIIERFKREFVQTDTFDRKFADALDFAFHITHECNCDQMKPPEDEDINTMIPFVRDFIRIVTQYMK